MISLINNNLRVLAVLAICWGVNASADQYVTDSKLQILNLVEKFRSSVKSKNQKQLESLFYDRSVPWLNVEPEQRTGSLPTQNGLNWSKGYFFSRAFNPELKYEQKLSAIKIKTDGEVGLAFFSEDLYVGGKFERTGNLAFQLVRLREG
jgi:hypothetical protein